MAGDRRTECVLMDDVQNLSPGWGCCNCNTYNGAHRNECKVCKHQYCGPRYEVIEHRLVSHRGSNYYIPQKLKRL